MKFNDFLFAINTDSVIAIDSLLTWLRDQVSCYNLQVIDVREAFVEGNVLCAVIHRFRPDLIEFPLPSEENVDPLMTAAFRNQLAFDILHQEYGISHVSHVRFASRKCLFNSRTINCHFLMF